MKTNWPFILNNFCFQLFYSLLILSKQTTRDVLRDVLTVHMPLTGVAGLRVHRNHHLAACPSPGSQGALQRGDAAGRFVAICSWNITKIHLNSLYFPH